MKSGITAGKPTDRERCLDTTLSETQHQTATFVFTDIEGSTALLKRLRDRYAEVLAQHRALLREAFTRHGGHEVDTQGDSFFFAFRRARDAVLAAVDGQRALATHDWPDDGEIRVRMGMHTGEASVENGRYTGVAVHRAARIGAAATGEQILLSQATHTILHDEEQELPEVEFLDLGEQRLKGLDRPVRIYQVVAPGLRAEFPPIRTGVQPAPRASRKRMLVLGLAVLALAAGAAVTALLLTRGGGEPKVALPVPPNSLVKIDPVRDVPVRVVPTGRIPGSVVATSKAVWVANAGDRTLTRYDPETNRAITVGGVSFDAPPAIASDGHGGVWATTGGSRVVHVNANGDAVPGDSITVPEGGTTGIASGGGYLWVTSPIDTSTSGRNTVTQISLRTKKPVKTWVVDDIPLFVTYGGGSAWVSNFHGENVSVLTPGLPARSVDVGGRPLGLASSGDSVWVGNYDDQKIMQIGPNLKPEAILPIGSGYLDVAADAKGVWVTNRDDGTVTHIDPRSGKERVVATVKLGNCPQNVATGPGGVWVTMRSLRDCNA